MNRRLLLIANPGAAAGRAPARWPALVERIRAQSRQVDQVITRHPGQAVTLAREASRDYEVIVAVGGDGTVNEVASGLVLSGATETALGIVPAGTGNDVAQMLGLAKVEDAVRALAHGVARGMDVIEVRCHSERAPQTRYALLYSSVGFAGELLRKTTPRVKRLFGPRFCYSVGFFRALLSYRAPMLKVTCHGREFQGPMLLASAGNAEVVGGGVMRLSPGAKIDDGKLDFNLIPALGRLETLRAFPRLLEGRHVENPKVHYFPGTSMTVEAEPVTEVQLDGEIFGQTPVTFEVRPGALRILTLE